MRTVLVLATLLIASCLVVSSHSYSPRNGKRLGIPPSPKSTQPIAPLQAQTAAATQANVDSSTWKCGTPGPLTVTFVDKTIYWTDYSAGTVVKAPVSGGTATIVASNQAGPCAITTDGVNLYWTNNSTGTVMKMPVRGGHPVVLARDQRQPSAIGVGESYVAWMTIDGPHKADMKTGGAVKAGGGAVKAAGDDSNAGSGTNPGTVKCHVCPIYCKRYIVQIPMGYWETYICGWYSCPPCGA